MPAALSSRAPNAQTHWNISRVCRWHLPLAVGCEDHPALATLWKGSFFLAKSRVRGEPLTAKRTRWPNIFFEADRPTPAQLAKIVEKLGMFVAITEIRIASPDGWQHMSPHHAR